MQMYPACCSTQISMITWFFCFKIQPSDCRVICCCATQSNSLLGDGVAQLLERRTQESWAEVRIPSGEICLFVFFRVKNVVLTRCRCIPSVYTHTHEWSHTHGKDPVVHVRVRWITETWKDPACTKKWQNVISLLIVATRKMCKAQWVHLVWRIALY